MPFFYHKKKKENKTKQNKKVRIIITCVFVIKVGGVFFSNRTTKSSFFGVLSKS